MCQQQTSPGAHGWSAQFTWIGGGPPALDDADEDDDDEELLDDELLVELEDELAVDEPPAPDDELELPLASPPAPVLLGSLLKTPLVSGDPQATPSVMSASPAAPHPARKVVFMSLCPPCTR